MDTTGIGIPVCVMSNCCCRIPQQRGLSALIQQQPHPAVLSANWADMKNVDLRMACANLGVLVQHDEAGRPLPVLKRSRQRKHAGSLAAVARYLPSGGHHMLHGDWHAAVHVHERVHWRQLRRR
jgi:hypothetical protein